MITIAEAAQPTQGWGGPAAILTAAAVCGAIAWGTTWVRDKIGNPSPRRGEDRGVSDPAQVRAVSGSDDTDPDTSRRGVGAMLAHIGGTPWLRVRQVLRTGSTAGWDDHLVDDEPEPSPEGLVDADEPAEMTVEEYVHQCDDASVPYTAMVREIRRTWQVSESTAKRAIRQAREAREHAEQAAA